MQKVQFYTVVVKETHKMYSPNSIHERETNFWVEEEFKIWFAKIPTFFQAPNRKTR